MAESPPQLQFQRLSPDADPAIRERIAMFFDTHISVDVPEVAEGLLDESRICFYLAKGDTVQAAGSIVLEGEKSTVDYIAVASNRREGIGRALLACLEQVAADQGAHSVEVFPVGRSEGFFLQCRYRADKHSEGMIKRLPR